MAFSAEADGRKGIGMVDFLTDPNLLKRRTKEENSSFIRLFKPSTTNP